MGHVTGEIFFSKFLGSVCHLSHEPSPYTLLQNDDFLKSCFGGKRLWGSDFLDFSIPHMGHLTGVKKILISQCRLCDIISNNRN